MRSLVILLCCLFVGCLWGQDPPAGAQESFTQIQALLDKKQPDAALKQLMLLEESQATLPQSANIRLQSLKGQCYMQLAQYPQASDAFQKGLSVAAGNDTAKANLLHQLGQCSYRLSQFNQATQQLTESRDIYRKLKLQDDPQYAGCLNTLGVLFKVQAKYSDAEKTFEEARRCNLRQPKGGENLQYARIINNLADVYCKLNRYEQAESYYELSLRLKEKLSGNKSEDYARTLYNLADFQNSLGRFEGAMSSIEECLSIYRGLGKTNHPEYLKCLDFQAILTENTGNPELAIRRYKEALQRREAMGNKQTDDYARNLLNLGHLLGKTGKTEEALPKVQEALTLIANIQGKTHPVYASALAALANLQSRQKNFIQAHQNYLEAIRITQKVLGKEHIESFQVQFEYAKSLRMAGKKAEAIQIYSRINKIPNQYLRKSARFLSEKELFEKVENYKAFSREIYSMLRQEPENTELTGLAYNTLLFYRGFILGTLQKQKTGVQRARNISSEWDELVSLQRQLENALYNPEGKLEEKQALEAKIMSLERSISGQLGDFQQTSEEISWEEVHLALGEGSAALEYLAFPDPAKGDTIVYGALLLKGEESSPRYVELCTELELAACFLKTSARKSDYVNAIYHFTERSITPIGGPSKSVVDLVWNPVQRALAGTKQVYLIPDGLLHRISISALPTGLETVVADSIELIHLNSSRQILNEGPGNATFSKNVLILGGMDYGQPEIAGLTDRSRTQGGKTGIIPNWRALPWADKECRDIAASFQKGGFQVNLLNGARANEAAIHEVLDKTDPWKVLHFATHGYFSEEASGTKTGGYYGAGMTNSGLVMAGANLASASSGAGQDGLLSAYEISSLNLAHTELVVLSACETGLGDIRDHEGVYGLQRAFRMAGAEKLIMSLWQARDEETKLFMVQFYKNWLEENTDIRTAFQLTQNQFRQRFIDPYLWAGFILIE